MQCSPTQSNPMQCNAMTEGHTSSSIFRRSSTTGSKFAASLGKNLTTTLYPLNHRQAYVTAVSNIDVEQPAHANGISVRTLQCAKHTNLHGQHHRLNTRYLQKAGLCSGAVQLLPIIQCRHIAVQYLMAWLEVCKDDTLTSYCALELAVDKR